MEIVLNNLKDTEKLAQKLAKEWLHDFGKSVLRLTLKGPLVVALYGDLGAGKTTFLQFFAKVLGIKEKVLSPTFTIIKTYVLPTQARLGYKFLRHIDTYRLKSAKELLDLGFKEIITDEENIVVIEWPEKVGRYLPKNTVQVCFEVTGENRRKVTVK